MKWFSRFFSVLCLLAIVTVFPVYGSTGELTLAFADVTDSNPDYGIMPAYEYTANINAALSFSGNNALCSGKLTPCTTDNTSITVTLYRQNGSSWSYVASWTGKGSNGNVAIASGSASVGSGTYKVVSSGNVGGKEFPSASITKSK